MLRVSSTSIGGRSRHNPVGCGGLHALVMCRGQRSGIVAPMTQVRARIRTTDTPCADGLGLSAISLNRRAVPREIAFWLIAYVFAAVMLGTVVPTPLYAIYQRQWRFSAGILTLIFAVYAVAVLATLLLAGRTSDQAGRRPVMAASLGFSAASAVLFIFASSPGWLYPARVLSGVSAGLMIGTATAALTEMVRESAARRASLVAASVSTGAAALGPLMAALFAQSLPQPTELVFELFLGLLAAAALRSCRASRLPSCIIPITRSRVPLPASSSLPAPSPRWAWRASTAGRSS